MAEIGIAGTLVPKTTEGVGMLTKHIKDDYYNKLQSAINRELYALGGGGGTGAGSGLGHVSIDSSYSVVILDSTKTFASQITSENTVYVIQDEFDLGGQIVWMKNNTTLWFYGGMLKNGCLKNAKETRNGWELYMTTIMTSFHKLCFSNVVLKGWWRGYGYDWMFEDTVRTEDDYLILNNVCQFEFAHIERKVINIKTWYNPYVEQYDLMMDASSVNKNYSSRSIQCYAGLNLDGHGCTINILMNDDEKMAQCGAVSRGSNTVDEDGNIIKLGYVWGVSLKSTFIRCDHKWKKRDDVYNGFELRNINIIDDNTINEKGADPTVFALEIYDPKYPADEYPNLDTYVKSKMHSNFMMGGDHKQVVFENVYYRGRCQVGAFGGNSDPEDTPLGNMYVNNCDLYAFNDMVFENFSGQEYSSFNAIYYTDSILRSTSHINSNSTTREKEVYTNCTLEGTSANESMEISYIFNNCTFKGGCMPVSGSGQTFNFVEVNNCTIELHGVNQNIASNRYINSVGTTVYNSCKFITDYSSSASTRAVLKFDENDRGTNNSISFLDCNLQLPNTESLSLSGSKLKGKMLMSNTKITSPSSALQMFTADEMYINTTNDSDIVGFLRNPLFVDKNNKNSVYGKCVCGWNYLSAPTTAVVVNDEVVSCKDMSIALCNTDIAFKGNIFSVTMTLDFPTIDYKVYTVVDDNFLFSFKIGNYDLTFVNKYGRDTLEGTIYNTTTEASVKVTIKIRQGVHNYTFSFDGSSSPIIFIDDKKGSTNSVTGYDNYSSIDFNSQQISATKITAGTLCGIYQLIVKPFAMI